MDSLETLFSLRGHVGIVTGASSGLGVECAWALAIGGADVVLVARRVDRLKKLADELREFGVKALPIEADVGVDADLDRVIETAVAEFGECDILINNAGISPTGRAEKFSRESWDSTLAINLTAPMMLSQRFARRLIAAKKPGRIINMGSIFSTVGSGVYRLSAYAAAKAGLHNITRQLAIEWAPYGINVNTLAPGWFPTEATEPGIEKAGNRERMELFTPMARLGKPEELRGAIIFLAGPSASFMTGAILSVDGGYTSW